jgi:hypothetical protein
MPAQQARGRKRHSLLAREVASRRRGSDGQENKETHRRLVQDCGPYASISRVSVGEPGARSTDVVVGILVTDDRLCLPQAALYFF